ncbi:MAG: hypothetical protein KGZ30_04060 [Anaplasmataceae bacterium]|nr:hypothetical protein [Anaplasmataceae bacterium]
MKIVAFVFLLSAYLLTGCVEVGYRPNYIISQISEEEKEVLIQEEAL